MRPIEYLMMSNRGFFGRDWTLNPTVIRGALAGLVALGLGLCGCSINGLRLPFTRAKPVATRPSPYAPVPIGPPSSPPPPETTTKYGDSVDRVVASVDGNPITNFDIENPGASGPNSLTGNSAARVDPNSALKQLIAQQLLEQE